MYTYSNYLVTAETNDNLLPPKKINLVHLSEDVLLYISTFIDLNKFCTTSKSLWNGELRKDIVYLFLRGSVALRFYKEEDFRTYIYSQVRNPNKQISLDLSDCAQVTDVNALRDVHKLNLTWCRNIIDVSSLGNVHTLNLTWCLKITDVSALGNVHKLNLNCCLKLIDVSALGNVHDLNLYGCYQVTDVSALTNVVELTLPR